MRHFRPLPATCRYTMAPLLFALCCAAAAGQETLQKPPEKPAAKSFAKAEAPEKAVNPAQIELLETKVRFEANGDSRKEVHAVVKINSELGVRQFARLTFDFNRSFEAVEIPLVHITHATGGTADILPSAISDQPNPAVVNAPAYQDVRVKSVRILGLQPSDTLEYRVIKTVSHHPLAPDFWLDHTFDRTGVVTKEIFELDLSASRKVQMSINPNIPVGSKDKSGNGESARVLYRWDIGGKSPTPVNTSKDASEAEPDIVLSTIDWLTLSVHLDGNLTPGAKRLESITSYEESLKELGRRYDAIDPQIAAKAVKLTMSSHTTRMKVEALYNFVSKKIATVDLPLGATGFVVRPAKEVLASGYATQEDKFALFAGLAAATKVSAEAGVTGYCDQEGMPRPTAFKHLLIRGGDVKGWLFWLDPSLEVAPFGVIPANSGKCVFVLNRSFSILSSTGHEWEKLETDPPFPSTERVSVTADLHADGALKSKVRYSMRGQNELVLRVAFHQTPKEKWKELVQLLSITDGFRGQVSSVNASDPYATKDPFTLNYEIEQPKLVDWSKKTVRIPALLPQLGLPEPAGKPAAGAEAKPIDLGTPLDVQIEMSLQLPPGTTASAPTGTSVERDYATYSSQYAVKGSTITASRHIHFLLREIPATRAADYNAFLHAVQSDEAQDFTLERNAPPASDGKSHL